MVTRIGPKRPFRLYIAEWREKAGLTQEQLAERVGTSKASISRWETGERDPTAKVLAAIAYALDREVADLFRDPARPSPDALLAERINGQLQRAVRLINTLIEGKSTTGTGG